MNTLHANYLIICLRSLDFALDTIASLQRSAPHTEALCDLARSEITVSRDILYRAAVGDVAVEPVTS